MPLGQIMSPKVFLSNQLASIPFFLFQFKTFKIQTSIEPWFWFRTWGWTWGYENSEDGETNPQDFKVTKNFSLHINLLRLDFFYKA